jgi:hypothetical protein
VTACAVALVLLLDASGSIMPDDWAAQRDHTAAALEDSAVVRAIQREGEVAITVMAFDVRGHRMVPWRVVSTPESVASLAREVRAARRPGNGATEIGQAVLDAMTALDAAPCVAEREVIDLSTDGEADAETAQAAREAATVRGVTINAIAVGPPTAAEWLREHAVTPSGFVMEAGSWGDYPAMLRRKLVLELAGNAPITPGS